MPNCNVAHLSMQKHSPGFSSLINECNSNFSSFSFLDLYFGPFNASLIASALFITLLVPLCFFLIKFNADKYLSTALNNFRERFKITPLITSCLLIPLVNGAPDIICSITSGERPQGVQVAVGCLVGSFVFGVAVIIAVVVKKSPKTFIEVSKMSIFKELAFYFLAVGLIVFMGLLKKINLVLVFIFPLLYIGYLFISLRFCPLSEPPAVDSEEEATELSADNFETQALNSQPALQQKISCTKAINVFHKAKRFVWRILKTVFDLTIPSESNPLMKARLKLLVTFCSTAFSLASFHFLSNWIMILFASYASLMVVLALMSTKKAESEQKLAFLALTLCSAVAWMKIFCALLLDAIVFCSLLVGTEQTFLSMVVISVGNSLQDLFSNASLVRLGLEELAIVATFSSQIFNLLIGLWLNFLISENSDFDLFRLSGSVHERTSGALLILLIAFVVAIIIVNAAHFLLNGGKYGKGYFGIGVSAYAAFFAASLLLVVYLKE